MTNNSSKSESTISSDQLDGFEERADHITEEVLLQSTVTNDYYDKIHDALVARGLVLIQGPRGCGKTHMMRYTHVLCRDDNELPLAIYVSFNRYLRLEPLLLKRTNALTLFQSWVLSRIAQAADDLTQELNKQKPKRPFSFCSSLELERAAIDKLVTHLERGAETSEIDDAIIRSLSIEKIIKSVLKMADHFDRKRIVLMLDDAALTLTPEFLIEFFDIVRVLKNPRIAVKVSIYPGTTEFGPRFHASHEGKFLGVWLPVDHPNYISLMDSISQRRLPESVNISEDVRQELMYASFGVPRAYLAMVKEWLDDTDSRHQQKLIKIIQNHNDGRKLEYESLAAKIPRFGTLVSTGSEFFKVVIEQLKDVNDSLVDKNEKQVILGVEESGITPLVSRMINLLIEAGLLYELTQVSHGPDRVYKRYIPHFAALIARRAFSGKSRGESAKNIVEFINRPSAKHPHRVKVDNIIPPLVVASLRIDMPACQKCGTQRLDEAQKFCHNCGSKLVDDSTFSRCMKLGFDKVPGLTQWQLNKLKESNKHVLGDLLSLQDPGTELRKLDLVGPRRAEYVVSTVESYVDEFLS